MLIRQADYHGPAFEHLHRFLHFSAQVTGDLLPAVQQRLGMEELTSQDGRLRLQQDIQQEAGERYLQHIFGIVMPHLGHRSTHLNGSIENANAITEPDVNDELAISQSIIPTLNQRERNQATMNSHSTTESSIVSLNRSSPSLIQTPLTSNSSQTDVHTPSNQQPHPIMQTDLGLPTEDIDRISGGNIAHGSEDIQQLFHNLTSEQLREPFEIPIDFNIDWDAEINAALVST